MSIVQRGRVSFNRLCEIIDAEPDLFDGKDHLPNPATGERPACKVCRSATATARFWLDVSFTLPAGGSLAIVGRTGSGKSTLAMLLARLIPTPPNTVRLDGKMSVICRCANCARRWVTPNKMRFLFSTTVARNIGLMLDEPDSPSSQQRLRQAAREAQILEEVRGLPGTADTVGERGVQLSGGQKRASPWPALLWQPSCLSWTTAVGGRCEDRKARSCRHRKNRRWSSPFCAHHPPRRAAPLPAHSGA